MNIIAAMCGSSKSTAQRLLLFLALMTIPGAICQTSDLIKGELEILLIDGRPPELIVRDGQTISPIIIPEDDVDKLIPYAGYTVQMRAAIRQQSPPTPDRALRKRPARPGRGGRQSAGSLSKTIFPASGISVKSYSEPEPTMHSMEVLEPADKMYVNQATGVQDIRTVVYLISFCGWKSSIDAATFVAIWINTPNTPPGAFNVQNFWANCTQGLASMEAANQVVVEVPLPCNGISGGKSYDFMTSCTSNEQYAWLNLAEEYAENTFDVDPSIKQRIVVLPKEVPCVWAAAANLGCSGTRCASWIHGNEATNPIMYMKAMGSNFGLVQSTSSLSSDGDSTCTMGSGRTCYNMANLWRLGWAKPVPNGELNSTNLPSGTWKTLQLPYATQQVKNHIRIVPNWAPTPRPDAGDPTKALFPGYYLSLRKNERFDAVPISLVPGQGRVLIHSSSAMQVENSYQTANLESVLGAGATYRTTLPFGIVVNVNNISVTTGATVKVCRADSTNERERPGLCNDGLDNDCNGLTDREDPACRDGWTAPPAPLDRRLPPSPTPKKRMPRPPPKNRASPPPPKYIASPPPPPPPKRRASSPPPQKIASPPPPPPKKRTSSSPPKRRASSVQPQSA